MPSNIFYENISNQKHFSERLNIYKKKTVFIAISYKSKITIQNLVSKIRYLFLWETEPNNYQEYN